MTPQDLARIHAQAFQEARPWSAAEIETLLASQHCFAVTVADGFALGRAIAGESELLTLAVAPTAQGKGLGRHLLELYHAKAQQLGSQSFFLEVARDNEAAIGLYESSGYTVTSIRDDYYKRQDGNRIDALIMTREQAESD